MHSRPILIAAVLILTATTLASAQSAGPARSVAFARSPAALAALAPVVAPAAILPNSTAAGMAPVRVGQGGRREAVALMIVGGAGIITGLLVDEDIITIAGAGVGGVGLYLYLR